MLTCKPGDRVMVDFPRYGKFMGIVDAINDSNVLVSYISETGDICSTWFNHDQVVLCVQMPVFDVIGDHNG
jgi:hypothetical protein